MISEEPISAAPISAESDAGGGGTPDTSAEDMAWFVNPPAPTPEPIEVVAY